MSPQVEEEKTHIQLEGRIPGDTVKRNKIFTLPLPVSEGEVKELEVFKEEAKKTTLWQVTKK